MVTTLSDDTVRWAVDTFCEDKDTTIFTRKDLVDFFQQSNSWASFVVYRAEVLDLISRIGDVSNGRGPRAVLWQRTDRG